MKRLLSLFILWLLFALNCTISMSLAGFFEMWKSSETMMMDHSKMGNSDEMDCCWEWEEESEAVSHECCISPVWDINVSPYQSNQTKKKLLLDWNDNIDTLWLCNTLIIEQNCITKITAPPEYRREFIVVKNTYSELVWVIKSNC